ncbi:hypothetical protein Rhal01_01738 [Rubritalea halochordaticola]|uniref:HTH arsR-type domain-containing protein n=1 Tax=Rubritalea halochordaticola TaxID=714537 RepID=A0ABP9V1U4_9BACT
MKEKQNMTDAQVEEAAKQFTILSEPARLYLLRALMEGEQNVTQLVEKTGLKQGTASKHLGLLANAGFIARKRDGNFVIYQISDPMVFELCKLMCCRLEEQARQRADELRAQ